MIHYCFTIPEEYQITEDYDNDDSYYYVEEDFNAGNPIRFSKACSGDWYMPGTYNQWEDGLPVYHCDSDHFRPNLFCNWRMEYILRNAVPSPDGYVTPLNCPKCGCTPGQNDVITLDQHYGTSV